ncbi:hypothetical protein HDU80_000757 [Chytriomyces hyalinus]|nr:hypothetical protein HDU80_000757 [Chytriomyces hyalinus]
MMKLFCAYTKSSDFTGNLLESSEFNATELSQSCKAASLQTASTRTINPANATATVQTQSNPTATNPNNSNQNALSGSLDQQQSKVPIIGGAVGAAVLVIIAVVLGVWFHRKRAKRQSDLKTDGMQFSNNGDFETVNMLSASSMPPPDAYAPALNSNAPVSPSVEDFLVAKQFSPVAGNAPLMGHIEVQPYAGYQTRDLESKTESLASWKPGMRENESFIGRNSMAPVTNKKKAWDLASEEHFDNQASPAQSHAYFDFARPSIKSHASSSYRVALPEDPKDWTKEEVAQWIRESFGDTKLSLLALRQNINGRVLLMLIRQELKSELGLETIGELRLFEEAVSELRMKSLQLN